MKAVIQIVDSASVTSEGVPCASIGRGMLVFFGVEKNDESSMIEPFLDKMVKMRVFKDENEKMNLSVRDIEGEILFISQFTLAADVYQGRRPGFSAAAGAETARELYLHALEYLRKEGYKVSEGVFQTHMKVESVNDGPETFILDSAFIKGK